MKPTKELLEAKVAELRAKQADEILQAIDRALEISARVGEQLSFHIGTIGSDYVVGVYDLGGQREVHRSSSSARDALAQAVEGLR